MTDAAILLEDSLTAGGVGPLLGGFEGRLAFGVVVLRACDVREAGESEKGNRREPEEFGFSHALRWVPHDVAVCRSVPGHSTASWRTRLAEGCCGVSNFLA
jgi:hypothetical protein